MYSRHITNIANAAPTSVHGTPGRTVMIHTMIRGAYRKIFDYERWYLTDVTQLETAVLHGGNTGNYFMLPRMGRIVDTNGDGVITGMTCFPLCGGCGTNPPLQFGLTMNASYKFSLVIGWQAHLHYDVQIERRPMGYGTRYRVSCQIP